MQRKQSIYLKMVEIAEKSFNEPHRQKYLIAAKEFRLPYYDYFRPRDGSVSFSGIINGQQTSFPYNFRLPDIFNEPTITVKTAPDDRPDHNFQNPLYSYHFSDKQIAQLNLVSIDYIVVCVIDIFTRATATLQVLQFGTQQMQNQQHTIWSPSA